MAGTLKDKLNELLEKLGLRDKPDPPAPKNPPRTPKP